MKYAVFTVMTPDWEVPETATNLSRLGYDGVEWRVQAVPDEIPRGTSVSYWGYNKATVDLNHIVERAPDVKRLCQQAGLEVCALASYVQTDQLAEIGQLMQAAQIMGCPRIRVNAPRYDRTRSYHDLFAQTTRHLQEVEQLARAHRIEANLEIHMGNIIPSAGLAHRLVSAFDPTTIGVIYDPGNMVHEGYEAWRMGLELLGPYLHHVHVKNALWEQAGTLGDGTALWRCNHAALSEGVANWHEILDDLKAVGYDGWMSFEDFSEAESTWDKCRHDLAYLKAIV